MPRFSLVLPTLKRPDTFRHALATLVRQTSDDCEIVIQNNGRDAATEAIVNEYADSRIRHFSSDTVLTMSDNWEAALANTCGDYVTFIGDDDGLFPDACAFAARVIEQGDVQILSWRPFSYYWPSYQQPELRNRLLATIDYDMRVEMVRSAYQLQQFYRFDIHYSELPMVYNSFVHRAVIERVTARAGRYFIGYSPDVVSGIVNAACSEQFALLSRPLSISGTSRHSTGHGFFMDREERFPAEKIARDFGELKLLDDIPMADNLYLFVAHDMLGVRDTLLGDRDIAFRYDRLLATVAAAINERPERYAETSAAIDHLARRHGIDMAAINIPAIDKGPAAPPCGATVVPGGLKVSFVIDGDPPGLANIDDAVRLIEQFRPRTEGELRHFEMRHVVLHAGQPVTFSQEAGVRSSLPYGWGPSEDWGVWSVAKQTALSFVVDEAPAAAFGLSLKYRAFLHAPQHQTIKVACRVRGRKVAEWNCTLPAAGGIQHLTIPRDGVLPDRSLVLEFEISEPRSPAELGVSADRRVLGIGLESIVLTTIT
jgi:glycosyltransferase involved in cell wall biosynthesis